MVVSVLALALASVPAPASAFHNPGIPLVDVNPLADDGYAAYRVKAPAGSAFSIEGNANAVGLDGNTASVGMWLLNPDLSLRFAIVFSAWSDGGQVTLLDLPDPVGVVVSKKELGAGPRVAMAITVQPTVDIEWVVVTVIGTDGGMDGGIDLYATPEVTYAKARGPGFLHREWDFDGGINVYASNPTARGPTVTKVIRDAHAAEPVDGRLFMLFQGFTSKATQQLELSYDSPSGNHPMLLDCPGAPWCIATAFLHGAPAGDYRLNIDHNVDYYDNTAVCRSVMQDLGGCFSPIVFAVGADVAVP